MLDAMAETPRAPLVLRLLEGVERVAIGAVADRVHGDRPPGRRRPPDDLCQLLAAGDLHARAVEQPSRLGPERAVHEHLEVADPEQVAADARDEADVLQFTEGRGRK